MGMARPLPILSALHSGTFFSRSGSAPFRDWKRRDTGPLEMGDGRETHGPAIPRGLPAQTRADLSPPGQGSPHVEQPAPCPSPLGTLQPRPPRSLSCPPTSAGRAVLAERGYL